MTKPEFQVAQALKSIARNEHIKSYVQQSTELYALLLQAAKLQLVEQLVETNHPVSIATHDEILIKEMEQHQYLSQPNIEIEMLYGIRPDMLSDLKNKGYNSRVYLTYGKEWYLYLCHRIAEYPGNLYHAVTDIIHSSSAERSREY
nr:hypothetical protein [Bacillus cereus group sp. BfR-BA-01380]